MVIRCEELIKLKSFKNIKLISGHEGLWRSVTWPYVGQSDSVAEWVYGGELLFITGIGMKIDTDSLVNLLKECILKKLAGIVILTGEEYINEIPKELICISDEENFPVFEMPWHIKLIDVTKEISNYIVMKGVEEKKENDFLGKLLFLEDYNKEEIRDLAKYYKMKIENNFFIGTFNINWNKKYAVEYTIRNMTTFMESVQHTISNLCREDNIKYISLIHGENIIFAIGCSNKETGRKYIEYLEVVHNILSKKYEQLDIYLSIGRIYESICDVKKSYRESTRALKLYKKSSLKDRIIDYSKLGIYTLLFEIDNLDEIKNYYEDTLGELIEYDLKNNSKLVDTLKEYLANNCNVNKTSQAMFLHRNTLIYRLNKIKEVLKRDLEDSMERLNLFNGIIVGNYLNSQN